MITVEALQSEVRDLKRRLDLTETRVGQMEGRFEFVSGQLKDIQLYMHAKFGDIESRFDRMEIRQDRMEQKIDALPRVLAEMLAKR
jgi:chaperonin cofactor prefoldin